MRFCGALLPFLLGLPLACENPEPSLSAVEPRQGVSDGALRLRLLGQDFIPATLLDPQSGRRIATSDGFSARIGTADRWAALTTLDWQSTTLLLASLPSNVARTLPLGALDVVVTDPRGREAVLPRGFFELGPDFTPPTVVFTSPAPGLDFAPSDLLHVSFHVSEPAPTSIASIAWIMYEKGNERARGSCPVLSGTHESDCAFQVTLSPSLEAGDRVLVVAEATDTAISANRGEVALALTLVPRPEPESISPNRGGTAGGTDVLIRGVGFVPGIQVTIDGEPLFPNGGILLDGNTISGHMPAHAPGRAQVAVRTPKGISNRTVDFTYASPPLVTAVAPDSGPAAGGTGVSIVGSGFDAGTQVYFGATLTGAVPLVAPFLQSDATIVGRTPPGSGATTVWVGSDNLGFSSLVDGFTWSGP